MILAKYPAFFFHRFWQGLSFSLFFHLNGSGVFEARKPWGSLHYARAYIPHSSGVPGALVRILSPLSARGVRSVSPTIRSRCVGLRPIGTNATTGDLGSSSKVKPREAIRFFLWIIWADGLTGALSISPCGVEGSMQREPSVRVLLTSRWAGAMVNRISSKNIIRVRRYEHCTAENGGNERWDAEEKRDSLALDFPVPGRNGLRMILKHARWS
jgi:hypothetical protein